jgi:hypothetical protein
MQFPAWRTNVLKFIIESWGETVKFKTAKINEFRLWGLLLTMGGMGLMILGTAGIILWGQTVGKAIASVFMLFGMITMLGSIAIYFWAGVLSTSAVMLECPECGKATKILGKTDRCMFCKTILSLDPKYEKKESD